MTPLERAWANRRASTNAMRGIWTDAALFDAFDAALKAQGVHPGSEAHDVALKALDAALVAVRADPAT